MEVFKFKRFSVRNERAAMKVNTDGVLLGAVMTLRNGDRALLDVGTGTGVIALMVAQRLSEIHSSPKSANGVTLSGEISPESDNTDLKNLSEGGDGGSVDGNCGGTVEGYSGNSTRGNVVCNSLEGENEIRIAAIDIDDASAEEAGESFAESPWREWLHCQCISLREYDEEKDSRFDVVFSNPPYFESSLKAPDERRRATRHADTMSYREIIAFSARHLTACGRLSLIIPCESEREVIRYAASFGLRIFRRVRVRTVPRRVPTRSVLEFLRDGLPHINAAEVVQQQSQMLPSDNTAGGRAASAAISGQGVANEEITIQDGREYTPQYRALMKKFLLF